MGCVELHPKLIHLPLIFALNIDPRINPILLKRHAGEKRSDRRGISKCDSTLAPP